MPLLTFSVLRNCKFKPLYYHLRRLSFSSDTVKPKVEADRNAVEGDPSHIELSTSWESPEHADLRTEVLRHMRVLPDFISEAEEQALLEELEPVLKRMRYEFDHWDNAIHGFRETERGSWRPPNAAVLSRVREAAFPPEAALLPAAHVLDLAPAGHIKPHVDAVRFCGAVIAGLCLCSSAVMRLAHSHQPQLTLDALLPRRGLYVMSGVARYSFSHELLGGEQSVWRGERLVRRRRVAVISRQQPDPHHREPDPQLAQH